MAGHTPPVQVLCQRLEAARRGGNPAAVAQICAQLLKSGPSPARSQWLNKRFQALSELAHPAAESALVALPAPHDPEQQRQRLWHRAVLAQRCGDFDRARELLLEIDASSPGSELVKLRAEALLRAMRLAYLQGDLKAGLAHHTRRTELFEASPNPAQVARARAEPMRGWRFELGADARALAALQQCRQQASPPEPQQLQPLLLQHPQATVLSLAYAQSLRAAGAFGLEAPLRPADDAMVPQQLWLLREYPGSTPRLEQRKELWARLHPGWQLQWVDHDPFHPTTQALLEQLPQLVRDACSCVNAPVIRGDLIRLALLWKHGGVAVEWNALPLRSIAPLLEGGVTLLLNQDEDGCIAMPLWAASPGHPLLEELLRRICTTVLTAQGYDRTGVSGGFPLTGSWAHWAMEMAPAGELLPAGCRVVPVPHLRRWLALDRALPRPEGMAEHPKGSPLFHQGQRRRSLQRLRSPG